MDPARALATLTLLVGAILIAARLLSVGVVIDNISKSDVDRDQGRRRADGRSRPASQAAGDPRPTPGGVDVQTAGAHTEPVTGLLILRFDGPIYTANVRSGNRKITSRLFPTALAAVRAFRAARSADAVARSDEAITRQG
jgi:hypothetical protein